MATKTSTMKPKPDGETPPEKPQLEVELNRKGAQTGRVSGTTPTPSNPPKPDPLPNPGAAAEELLWLHARAADAGCTINDYITDCIDSIVIYERYIGRVDGLEAGGPHGDGK